MKTTMLLERGMQIDRRSAERRGLTLIELVVVMLILAAVAGIVLPLLPGMVTRAHTSTGATNVSELAKAIQTHEAMYLSYPTNFDSLVVTNTLATYVPGSTSNHLAVLTLTDGTADALADAGVTSVLPFVAATTGDWSPTFYPYGTNATIAPSTLAVTVTDSLVLPSLTTTGQISLGLPVGPTYVVLGVGGYTSMQGKSLQEAPLHFTDSPTETPEKMYSRYGAVFQITDTTGNAFGKAKLSQIVGFHDDGVVGLNKHLAEYFEAASPK